MTQKKNILRASASGQLDLNEYRRVIEEIVTSTDHPPTVATIWDLRTFDFAHLDRNLEERVLDIDKTIPDRKEAKRAFVVKDKLGFGMIRMLQILGDDQTNTKIFYVYHKAEEWISNTA